ncbi:MAG: MBOAT family protein [Chloroflexaceae bacterium]|nr:MBOAT family protein [Chloroflexaceae bacterium]
MLFNSYVFIFAFLPITLGGYFLLTHKHWLRAAQIWLTLSSLCFYGYSSPIFLLVMVLSIAFNHQMGGWIAAAKPQGNTAKIRLWSGIVFNIAIIGYYKYTGFAIASFNGLSGANLPIPEIILPIGISFYTFTQIAYLVDVYRGEIQGGNYNLLTYSLFVVFFPQLIAGPILRHDEFIPQLGKLRVYVFSHKNFALGTVIFCLGLAKKVLIADTLSPWVALVFNNAPSVNCLEAWVGALSYTLQLYFDFSGYSDMAIGLGLMFNLRLPINFDSPYKAISIVDFWRRWHITLSNFLRDYLYIPLGGSRKGEGRRYANLLTTMLLGGLWHGAGWTFVIWGGLHGLYLCINHGWRKLKLLTLPKPMGWALTFLAVIFSWALFRAQTFTQASQILGAMLGFGEIVIPGSPKGKLAFLTDFGLQVQPWSQFSYLPNVWESELLSLLLIFALILGAVSLPNTQQIVHHFQPNWRWAIAVGLLASFCLLSLNRVSEFLYFQF